MRVDFAIAAVAAVFLPRCLSGALPEDPRTYATLIIHERGSGSGCALWISNSTYLVTAKHVIFTDPEGTNVPALRSPTAVMRSFSGRGRTNTSERVLRLNLAELQVAGEIRFATNHDVTLVRIMDTVSSNGTLLTTTLPGVSRLSDQVGLNVTAGYQLCPFEEIDVGADAYMFGYPLSITGPISAIFNPYDALLRKGIVAGVNVVRRTIIIDCPAYHGNSGGPVLQVEGGPGLDRHFRIIGIVSAFVPFDEVWENKTLRYSHVIKSNSGYTVVEPIETALELAWK